MEMNYWVFERVENRIPLRLGNSMKAKFTKAGMLIGSVLGSSYYLPLFQKPCKVSFQLIDKITEWQICSAPREEVGI